MHLASCNRKYGEASNLGMFNVTYGKFMVKVVWCKSLIDYLTICYGRRDLYPGRYHVVVAKAGPYGASSGSPELYQLYISFVLIIGRGRNLQAGGYPGRVTQSPLGFPIDRDIARTSTASDVRPILP